jgi:hypothetical protein
LNNPRRIALCVALRTLVILNKMKIKLIRIALLSLNFLSACTGISSISSALPPPSYASTECGRNFTTSGDPRNGALLTTFLKFHDLDVLSAIGQVEKIAMDQGMQVGSDQVDKSSGKVTIVVKDTEGGHDYPMVASALKNSGQLTLIARLAQGQMVDPGVMRDRMCNVITKVKMDSAGASIAAATQKKLGTGQIIDIKAIDLVTEVAKALQQKQDASDVAMKYSGKVYRIDGRISRLTGGMGLYGEMKMASTTKSFSIPYITEVHGGLLGIGPMVPTRVQIICRSEPNQYYRFLALRNGDYATLIAKVTSFIGKGRPKSIIVDNPLTTPGSLFSDQSYGGTLYADCSFEK